MSKSTKTTLDSKMSNVYGVQNWDAVKSPVDLPSRLPEVKSFFDHLWPVADPYVSSLNPVFLLDLPAAASSKRESWLVRDGLLPLIWFFYKNPAPVGFKSMLRVHADFEEFVPESWRPQTELYELFPENKTEDKSIRELLLMGLVMPSVCSLDRLESDLDGILHFIGGKKNLSRIKIRAFLPTRFETIDPSIAPSYHNRYLSTLCRELGTDIEFLELENFRWMYPLPGTWMHEFNEKWLYADSYLSQLAMSKNGCFIPLGKTSKVKFDQIIPIYPHVSCGMRKEFKKPFVDFLNGAWVPESKERAETFYRVMNSHANVSYPWPNWFNSWCRNFV